MCVWVCVCGGGGVTGLTGSAGDKGAGQEAPVLSKGGGEASQMKTPGRSIQLLPLAIIIIIVLKKNSKATINL